MAYKESHGQMSGPSASLTFSLQMHTHSYCPLVSHSLNIPSLYLQDDLAWILSSNICLAQIFFSVRLLPKCHLHREPSQAPMLNRIPPSLSISLFCFNVSPKHLSYDTQCIYLFTAPSY